MDLSRDTGWWPWIPQDARDVGRSPYGYRTISIARAEWETPQEIDPRCLDPMMNVVDLWWRPAAPQAWLIPDDRHGHWQTTQPPTLATLYDRLDALARFVGHDPADHTPLDEAVTIEERLRTLDTAVELMQQQLDEVLALLKGKTDG